MFSKMKIARMFKNPFNRTTQSTLPLLENTGPGRSSLVDKQNSVHPKHECGSTTPCHIHVIIPDMHISDELRDTSTFAFLEHPNEDQFNFNFKDLLEVANPAFAYVKRFERDNNITLKDRLNLYMETKDTKVNLPNPLKSNPTCLYPSGKGEVGKKSQRKTCKKQKHLLRHRLQRISKRSDDPTLSKNLKSKAISSTSRSWRSTSSNSGDVQHEAEDSEAFAGRPRRGLDPPRAEHFNEGHSLGTSYGTLDMLNECFAIPSPPSSPLSRPAPNYARNWTDFSSNYAQIPESEVVANERNVLPPARVARPHPSNDLTAKWKSPIDSLNEGSDIIGPPRLLRDSIYSNSPDEKHARGPSYGAIGNGKPSNLSPGVQSEMRNRDVEQGFTWQQLYPDGLPSPNESRPSFSNVQLASSIFEDDATQYEASLISQELSQDTSFPLVLPDIWADDEEFWWLSLIPGADKPGIEDALVAVINGDNVTREIAMSRRVMLGHPRNPEHVPTEPPTPKEIHIMRGIRMAQNPPEFCDIYTLSPRPI